MIKVRYDATTGKIGKSYPESMNIPQPYFEMSKADHDELRTIALKDGEDLFFRDTKFVIEQDLAKQEQYLQSLKISKTDLFKAIYLSKGLQPQDIRTAIEQIADEQQRVLALIDFDNAKDFYRKHPLFGDFAISLGFTKEDIDNIFLNAQQL